MLIGLVSSFPLLHLTLADPFRAPFAATGLGCEAIRSPFLLCAFDRCIKEHKMNRSSSSPNRLNAGSAHDEEGQKKACLCRLKMAS
jgi:hypothetical protein